MVQKITRQNDMQKSTVKYFQLKMGKISDDRTCFDSPARCEFGRNFKKPLFFSRSNVSRDTPGMRIKQTVGVKWRPFAF